MRQRIREVAALRKIPDDEIKPTLRLKHQEIARFSKVHRVNLAWLLEGGGPMFIKGPDVDRSSILTIVREVMAEREQRSAGANRPGSAIGSRWPMLFFNHWPIWSDQSRSASTRESDA